MAILIGPPAPVHVLRRIALDGSHGRGPEGKPVSERIRPSVLLRSTRFEATPWFAVHRFQILSGFPIDCRGREFGRPEAARIRARCINEFPNLRHTNLRRMSRTVLVGCKNAHASICSGASHYGLFALHWPRAATRWSEGSATGPVRPVSGPGPNSLLVTEIGDGDPPK